jgi:serine-type D-Ala-D-Ala carboxypeptidase (penicillin-binding protein 5/6)
MKRNFMRFIAFLIVSTIILTIIPIHIVQANVQVSARNAILMDQLTGRILFEKNAHEKRKIASITKIMTAIIAIESGKLDEIVTVSNHAVGVEGSSIYLTKGEKIKLEDLVYGLMLRSGNDAAVAIAEHVGGSLEGFVFLMNEKAEQIGMKNTHFSNPHGLDDHEDHYSTAYDMALLTKYAMRNETYRKISGTKIHRAKSPDGSWYRTWKNKNRLLTELYQYCTGGKTGYTKKAKRTLVTTASKNGMDLIAVTLNGPDDWNDHIAMYESAFSQFDYIKILSEGEIDSIKDPAYKNKVYIKRDVIYPLTKKETEQIKVHFDLMKPKKKWRKNDREVPEIVGKVVIYLNEYPIQQLPVYFEHEVRPSSLFDKFSELFLAIMGVKSHD